MILSKFNRVCWLGSGLLLLGSALAHAQSDAVLLKRATELREAPGENSRSLAALAVRTSLARSDAWIQVRTTGGTSGWVHMFDVGSAASAEALGAKALRGVTSFLNRGKPARKAPGTVVPAPAAAGP